MITAVKFKLNLVSQIMKQCLTMSALSFLLFSAEDLDQDLYDVIYVMWRLQALITTCVQHILVVGVSTMCGVKNKYFSCN